MELSDNEEPPQVDKPVKSELKKHSKKISKHKSKRPERPMDAVSSQGALDNPEALVEGLDQLDEDAINAELRQLEGQGGQNSKKDPGELDEDEINAELARLGASVNDKDLIRGLEKEETTQKDQRQKHKTSQEPNQKYDMTQIPEQKEKHGKDSEMVEDAECDNIVMNLIDKMRDAYDKDKASNLEKKPAFERLKLLKNIDTTLQRNDVREIFLEKDGCHELTEWLKRMPDETYPNQKIIITILTCIDRLPISRDHIMEHHVSQRSLLGNLEQVLKMYKQGDAGSGYKDCKHLATSILNKMYKLRFKIQSTYDEKGEFEREWKNLEYQIEVGGDAPEKKDQQEDVNEEDEEQEIQPKKKRGAKKQETSIDIEEENVIDQGFRNQPAPQRRRRRNEKNDGSWAKVKKSMISFKRACRPATTVKGGMAIVKSSD